MRFEQSARPFDFGGASSVLTDWPSPETPWLAVDRDGDGLIGSAAELFGSRSPLRGGGVASNGFVALRELDSNGDGRIAALDRSRPRPGIGAG